MTEADRIAKAQRAKAALDEFFAPVVDDLRAEYIARLLQVSTGTLGRNERSDKQTALSTALKLLENLSASISAIIQDGDVARGELAKKERRLDLTPARRRLLDIAPY